VKVVIQLPKKKDVDFYIQLLEPGSILQFSTKEFADGLKWLGSEADNCVPCGTKLTKAWNS
jgi:hypothetical protein